MVRSLHGVVPVAFVHQLLGARVKEEFKPLGHNNWLAQEGLALEDVVDCDTEGCEYVATQYAQVSCCDSILFACDACMRQAQRVVVWMVHNGRIIICNGCKERVAPRHWLGSPQPL
jgi:hypothetical protein